MRARVTSFTVLAEPPKVDTWSEYERGYDDGFNLAKSYFDKPDYMKTEPAEQGDTGSDEKSYSNETWAAAIVSAEQSAVRQASRNTDSKVAEAVAQIVAALRMHTIPEGLTLRPRDLDELADRLQALADGENGDDHE